MLIQASALVEWILVAPISFTAGFVVGLVFTGRYTINRRRRRDDDERGDQ